MISEIDPVEEEFKNMYTKEKLLFIAYIREELLDKYCTLISMKIILVMRSDVTFRYMGSQGVRKPKLSAPITGNNKNNRGLFSSDDITINDKARKNKFFNSFMNYLVKYDKLDYSLLDNLISSINPQNRYDNEFIDYIINNCKNREIVKKFISFKL